MQYFFILGNNTQLSKFEIESVLALKNIKYQINLFNNKILVLEINQKIDIDWFNQRLGGTVKIGKILDNFASLENLGDNFCHLIKCEQGKLHFGFSLYALNENINIKKYLKKLKPIAMEIKRSLREEKHLNSRWVVSKEPELSAVVVKKNQLLKYGSEICLFISQNKVMVGQTLAVQLFEEFGARDYNRPARDDVSGMLPPKLAKIMINLAQAKESEIILDPFCGSGTILQEAILMGYLNLRGYDKSEKAIKDTQQNLQWLKTNIKHFKSKNIEIKQVDVNDLGNNVDKQSVDYVISEPYLGPPLKGNETELQIKANISELTNLYIQAFNQFSKVLKKQGKVVMVIPEFNIKKQIYKINLSDIKDFKIINKEKLTYFRPGQQVIRNIIIWQKV